MNQVNCRFITLVRFVGPVMAAAVILLNTSVECRSQSPEISSVLSQRQSKQTSLSELDWDLLDLNIRRAYEKHDDYSAQPVVYNRHQQRFRTGFYVSPNSAVLKLTARAQIEQFQVEMKGLALLLAKTLDLPEKLERKIDLYIEAEFTTIEDGEWVVVARYRDGKMQLVHEKVTRR